MKIKLPASFWALIVLSLGAFAQRPDFDLQISVDQNVFTSKSKAKPAKVLITNKSENALDTSKLSYISFYLSKCVKTATCDRRGEVFVSHSEIKPAILKKEQSLEFEVNLADLYWQDVISSWRDMRNPKNLDTVPFSNNNLYADIKVFDKYHEVKGEDTNIPLYKSYQSNEIMLSIGKLK